ncbi:hypothetical protein [Candidatus Solirubrobacter pratensis]|uniref:hypothetical protein n=1 Tax=Candidatus Solirubrobacter pratensis TaxID=1298857 RepID=UPI00056666FD|nr:hypothetical protein [Candidatus Solirubrobacter pratensis]
MRVSDEAIEYATQRVEALMRVNFTRPKGERSETLETVWEGVGVTNVDLLYQRAGEISEHAGPFLTGVLFGLFVRQFDY